MNEVISPKPINLAKPKHKILDDEFAFRGFNGNLSNVNSSNNSNVNSSNNVKPEDNISQPLINTNVIKNSEDNLYDDEQCYSNISFLISSGYLLLGAMIIIGVRLLGKN